MNNPEGKFNCSLFNRGTYETFLLLCSEVEKKCTPDNAVRYLINIDHLNQFEQFNTNVEPNSDYMAFCSYSFDNGELLNLTYNTKRIIILHCFYKDEPYQKGLSFFQELLKRNMFEIISFGYEISMDLFNIEEDLEKMKTDKSLFPVIIAYNEGKNVVIEEYKMVEKGRASDLTSFMDFYIENLGLRTIIPGQYIWLDEKLP